MFAICQARYFERDNRFFQNPRFSKGFDKCIRSLLGDRLGTAFLTVLDISYKTEKLLTDLARPARPSKSMPSLWTLSNISSDK